MGFLPRAAPAGSDGTRESAGGGELASGMNRSTRAVVKGNMGNTFMNGAQMQHGDMTEHSAARQALWRPIAAALVCLIASVGASRAQREDVSLPNAGFEEIGGTVAPEALQDAAVATRVPSGWIATQWAPAGSKFRVIVDPGAGRRGTAALAARNLDTAARPGVTTPLSLSPGRYVLSFYVRCQEGKQGLVRAWLGDGYSPVEPVGPGWRRVTYERTIPAALTGAELRLQNCSRSVTTVWFDDVSLQRIPPRTVKFVPDKRRRPPKTLLLSPLSIPDLQRDAAIWAERGVGGFLLQGIMTDWNEDIWGVDGDPATMGEEDAKLQEVLACTAACRAQDIDTFIYLPCRTPLPVWLDDGRWMNTLEAIQQVAVFAARAQCKGVAIDLEAVADQFWPQWPGYNYGLYPKTNLRRDARMRGAQIARVVFGAEPTLELLLMPEGVLEYGPMFEDLFRGIIEQAGEARYKGGVHLLAKSTFDVTSAEALLDHAGAVDVSVKKLVNRAGQRYWQKHCSLALGCRPLGYARRITDAVGAPIGWGGRKEIFGDEVIGEYADRGPRYPIEQFREQFAGAMTAATKYVWIDTHGPTWWRDEPTPSTDGMTSSEAAKVRARHTVENIEDYYSIVREHQVVKITR